MAAAMEVDEWVVEVDRSTANGSASIDYEVVSLDMSGFEAGLADLRSQLAMIVRDEEAAPRSRYTPRGVALAARPRR